MPQTLAAGIAPATRPKISFAGVNKFYGSNRARAAATLALDDFDLDIAPEEIISIVGPTNPEAVPMSMIQSSIDAAPLNVFVAAGRAKP